MKKTKALISLMLTLLISLCFTACDGSSSGSMAEESKAISEAVSSATSEEDSTVSQPEYNKKAGFILDLKAVPSETEAGIVNAVITLTNLKCDLSAIQFELTYSSNTVEAVYTTNDEMIKTMTVVPMYETTQGVSLSRFEQICVLNKSTSTYRCMYVDLLSYPGAKEGQTFTGMKNDGEMVITIPFKVNADASAGNNVVFELLDGTVKGTESVVLESVVGDGGSATYTLVEKDIVK